MRDKRDKQNDDETPETDVPAIAEDGEHDPRFRWAPGAEAIDASGVAKSLDSLGLLGEEIARQVPALTEMGNVVGAAAVATALAKSRLGEQLRELARIEMPASVQFQFPANLGRVLEANRRTWFANAGRLIDRALELVPENLRALELEQLKRVFLINEEDGTSLAWAPRADIVEELLAAPDIDARSAVLVARVAEIAHDVDASLMTVTLAEHQQLRTLLAESVAALRAGLHGPAQAAASAVLDTLLYVHVLDYLQHNPDTGKLETRRHFKSFAVDGWEDATLSQVELVLVGAGVLTAFKSWKRGKGQSSFNRNGSVHQADDGAYSPAHAVRAVLIAQALLRWLDDALADVRDEEGAA